MYVKVVDSIFRGKLENLVNEFISDKRIKVIDIKFQYSGGGYAAMILYEYVM